MPATTTPDTSPGTTGVPVPSAADVPSTDPAPTTLAPTIACEDTDNTTVETTEGPYFSTGSPERSSLVEASDQGTPFTLSGLVTTTECVAVARAKIELWHADPFGEYDNVSYRYRGHFFTADDGTFVVETFKAGLYPGRTRHFHIKVQPADGSVLTTQLFWPDEDGNAGDGIFDATLVMSVSSGAGSESGSFHFVV
jgi:protocatechuate 3,4-dioxygenase beta subunit